MLACNIPYMDPMGNERNPWILLDFIYPTIHGLMTIPEKHILSLPKFYERLIKNTRF